MTIVEGGPIGDYSPLSFNEVDGFLARLAVLGKASIVEFAEMDVPDDAGVTPIYYCKRLAQMILNDEVIHDGESWQMVNPFGGQTA